jgi:protein-tyrosine phosphatase
VPAPPPFADIHCHVLPGLDDGAQSWEQSLEMARLAAADGITTVVATPHQLGGHAGNHGDRIRERTAQLQKLLDEHGCRLRVLPGADVRIEPDLVRKIQSGEVLTLADRGRYVLLELPHEVYLPLDRLLDELASAGLVGILSHPERNLGILAKPEVAAHLVDAGCLMQVTAGSLMGTFGPRSKAMAESLVTAGLVHFLATDAHGHRVRRPLLRRAYERVAELAGPEAAMTLCSLNPASVVADRKVLPGRRKPQGRGWPGWFRWRKAG